MTIGIITNMSDNVSGVETCKYSVHWKAAKSRQSQMMIRLKSHIQRFHMQLLELSNVQVHYKNDFNNLFDI